MAYATSWDLTELLPSLAEDDVDPALKELESRIEQVEAWRDDLDAIDDPKQVSAILDDLAALRKQFSRMYYRGYLAFSADTGDDDASGFLSRMENLEAEVDNRVRFVELWWKTLDEDRAASLVPEDPDEGHYLKRLREFAPYTLEDAEERVIALKDVGGKSAVQRARDILESDITFTDPETGEEITKSELLRGIHHHDPDVREAAYRELWEVWQDHVKPFAHLYRAVVQDWYNEHVELRGYEAPIDRRHMLNDVPAEAVEALLAVCRDRADLFEAYFVWKGDQLGIEMDRYHIYAPLRTEAEPDVPFDEAASTVLDVLDGFDDEVAGQARRVFEESHVDAFPAKAKRGGAYCATVSTDHTPYLFLNHTDDRSSLKTLAHEMGHAIHSMQAEDRHELVSGAGLCLAETASVFSEMLLHDHLVEQADDGTRRQLLSDKVTEVYQTVQRQAFFALFELDAHPRLRQGAPVPEIHDLYMDNLQEQFGSVPVPDRFRIEWTYIPHFVHSPFYVYAYSFGMLLSLALYDTYRREGDDFVPNYKAILAAGGSRSPGPLIEDEAGFDIAERAFWERGFAVVEDMVDELGAR